LQFTGKKLVKLEVLDKVSQWCDKETASKASCLVSALSLVSSVLMTYNPYPTAECTFTK